MASNPQSVNGSESEFEFIETPKAPTPTFEKFEDCGVRTTNVSPLVVFSPPQIRADAKRSALFRIFHSSFLLTFSPPFVQYPCIKNAPLPADGPGSEGFSNIALLSLIGGVPCYFSWKVGGGWKTTLFFAIFTSIPLLVAFWSVASTFTPRKNEKVRLPGRPVEHYLTFHKEADRLKYRGKNKIPMETFHEMYFDGDVDFNGDCLEVLEYRHDWASFRFTISLFKFFLTGMMPEVIMHTRSQGKSLHIGEKHPLEWLTKRP
jgi:hypothetical protein